MFKTSASDKISMTNEEEAWFCEFELLEDNLTKSLFLVTLLNTENLIEFKELTLMKRFLLERQDNRKTKQILAAFKKSKSLL